MVNELVHGRYRQKTLRLGDSIAQAGARPKKIGAVAGNRTRMVAVRKDLLGKELFCC